MPDLSTLITELELITDFMRHEYSITPSQKSLETIADADFKLSEDPGEQFANLENVQRRIKGNGQDTLVAKVFALAFPYKHVLRLSDEKAGNWAVWLGTAEYKLARISEGELKDNFFNKALTHLLDSRQKGNSGKENASYIGRSYLSLGNYEEALTFFLESRQKGNSGKENAGCIGECYFRLGNYEEALPFLLESRQKGDSGKENAGHIGNCYFRLGQFEEALPFFLESRQKGNSGKENAGYIGECYFRLGQFEEGVREYEMAIKLAKNERFNIYWMRAMGHVLEHSFKLLNRAGETIQSPVYDGLLQRFQAIYNNFAAFWNANEPNKTYFRLILDGHGNPTNGIMNTITPAS